MSVKFPAQALPVVRIRRVEDLAAPLVTIGAIAVLHYETLWSMIVLWSRSQTFAHGFVIAPISAWMIWRQRDHLARFEPRPALAALILLTMQGVAWLLASLANVPAVAQYAVVSMIPSAVIATLGWEIARLIAFPLAYLLLAVPFGEFFIPYLIDFTATFAVGALQLSGVPVFREGNYFSIPSGTWSVIEACSGLRYLIASLALGTLYAQLNYRGIRRRLIFIGAALIVPILANGMRAYLIVMIGHWSNMQLAAGIDHLIYGWVFFGLVSLILFWCASIWPEPAIMPARLAPQPASATPRARQGQTGAALASVSIIACWPLLAALLADTTARPAVAALNIAPPVTPWRVAPANESNWRSPQAGMPLQFRQSYQGPNGTVHLQLTWSPTQAKDTELLTPELYLRGEHWRVMSNDRKSIIIGKRRLNVLQTILKNESHYQLVWRWHRQSGIDTDSLFLAKLLFAKSKLLRIAQDHADILIAAPFDEQSATAELAMYDFLSGMFPAIDNGLRNAARR